MPGRRRILIAEDDSLVRELVRSKLTSAGYDAHTARCGREALERMVVVKPHALLLDLNLPDIDGFMVLEGLRDQEAAAPAMVLTASGASEDVQRAVALGARDYLTKDRIQSHLLPRLARMLRSAEQAAPAEAA
ncbi:MAG: response regulator [Caulobacteraceae bacterium]|nr:response regulator [Caulobacteraceae bacterium]